MKVPQRIQIEPRRSHLLVEARVKKRNIYLKKEVILRIRNRKRKRNRIQNHRRKIKGLREI